MTVIAVKSVDLWIIISKQTYDIELISGCRLCLTLWESVTSVIEVILVSGVIHFRRHHTSA